MNSSPELGQAMDFETKLAELHLPDHYLCMPGVSYDAYLDGLRTILGDLAPRLRRAQWEDLLEHKLQLAAPRFDEAQYIQTACELTAMGEFLRRDDIELAYEKKVSPPADVDFSISGAGRVCHVEVKCPTYDKTVHAEDVARLKFSNRAPTKATADSLTEELRMTLAPHGRQVVLEKNLDNKLKDYLLSAQKKMKQAAPTDVNVLLIGCDDALDMQEWRGYLFDVGGLFTEQGAAVVDPACFDRVDYVLLTNLHHRHYRHYQDTMISRHWSLGHAFNLLYPNRFSVRNQAVNGAQELAVMNRLFPNHSVEFEQYLRDDQDLPPNESLEMKRWLGVAWFSDRFRRRGIYHFRHGGQG